MKKYAIAFAALLIGSIALACNVPVFRYALERWLPDPYEVIVFHQGPLTKADKELIQRLSDAEDQGRGNLRLHLADVEKLDKPLAELYRGQQNVQLPWLAVRYPEHFGNDELVWAGRFDSSAVTMLLHSPARQEIARRLTAGHSAVWLLLESGDARQDDAAARLIEAKLKELPNVLKLPDLTDNPEDKLLANQPLKIDFSLLRLKHADPAERFLTSLLLKSEDDLVLRNDPPTAASVLGLLGSPSPWAGLAGTASQKIRVEPMLFPVFGRGRSLFAWIGKGITADHIEEDARFLIGPCSCTVKRMNPGFDLLFTAEWEAMLGGKLATEKPKEPELMSLSSLGKPPAKSDNLQSQAKAVPPMTAPPTPAAPASSAPAASGTALWRNLLWVGLGGLVVLAAGTLVLLGKVGQTAEARWRFNNPWLIAAGSAAVVGLLALLLWSPWDRPAIAGKSLRLYCAAGMSKPVADIIRQYGEQYGVEVQATYAGSGTLLSTIAAQARGQGDLFLSGDDAHMIIARQKGLVAEVIPVVTLQPVLAVNRKTQDELTRQGKPITSVEDLLRDDVKVVLANPEEAAVGQLGKQVLSRPAISIWPRLERRLRDASAQVSTVGTVNEVARIVRTNDRTIGIIWDALARQHDDIVAIDMPEFAGATSQVQIGVLAQSEQPTAALQFARFLTARDRGLKVFERDHYQPPAEADVWAEAPELTLSVGAMLKPGVEEVFKQFEQREGVRINTSYAGCGLLVAQMKSLRSADDLGPARAKGGRFPDAYFACDQPFLDDVQPWFGPGVTVAQNEVLIIVKKGNPKGVKGLADLTRADLKIGLAHPVNSALGTLVDNLLKKLGLHAEVYTPNWQDRLVHTDAAHDLVNKLRLGALDLAVVYRSNVQSTPANLDHMDIIQIDRKEALATQPFAIAADTRHPQLMRRLLEAIVARESAERFQSLGFRWVYGSR